VYCSLIMFEFSSTTSTSTSKLVSWHLISCLVSEPRQYSGIDYYSAGKVEDGLD
jgi:hypothetical protein